MTFLISLHLKQGLLILGSHVCLKKIPLCCNLISCYNIRLTLKIAYWCGLDVLSFKVRLNLWFGSKAKVLPMLTNSPRVFLCLKTGGKWRKDWTSSFSKLSIEMWATLSSLLSTHNSTSFSTGLMERMHLWAFRTVWSLHSKTTSAVYILESNKSVCCLLKWGSTYETLSLISLSHIFYGWCEDIQIKLIIALLLGVEASSMIHQLKYFYQPIINPNWARWYDTLEWYWEFLNTFSDKTALKFNLKSLSSPNVNKFS